MNKIKKQIKKELKIYNFTKEDKAFLYSELVAMYDDESELDNEILKSQLKSIMIENEIYEIEEIKLSIILYGFLFIMAGISFMFNMFDITLFICFALAVSSLDMYERKNKIFSLILLITALLFLNMEIGFFTAGQIWTGIVGIAFVILGIKVISKPPNKKGYNDNNSHVIKTTFSTRVINLLKENNLKIIANFSTVTIDTTEYNFNGEFLIIDLENLCSDVKIIIDDSTYIRSNISGLESISATIHPANKIIISGKNTFGQIYIEKGK